MEENERLDYLQGLHMQIIAAMKITARITETEMRPTRMRTFFLSPSLNGKRLASTPPSPPASEVAVKLELAPPPSNDRGGMSSTDTSRTYVGRPCYLNSFK